MLIEFDVFGYGVIWINVQGIYGIGKNKMFDIVG